MLQTNGEIKRKWTWAIDWLNDEMERVKWNFKRICKIVNNFVRANLMSFLFLSCIFLNNFIACSSVHILGTHSTRHTTIGHHQHNQMKLAMGRTLFAVYSLKNTII